MDELDQYAAFAALIRKGENEEQIAACFGITAQTVRRRLALARLIPDIHRLYRDGEIDGDTLKLLTLAPKERQRAFVAALRDPDAEPMPPRWQPKAWLLGGAEIDTRHALFDAAAYKGNIAGDLFSDRRYFTDAGEFWRLQNEAVAKLGDELGAKGWSTVTILGPDAPYYPHQWSETRKDDGGGVVIAVAANGSVEVHKGLIGIAEANKRRSAALKTKASAVRKGDPAAVGDGAADGGAPGEDGEDRSAGRPEMTVPLANYCDLVRLAAVRLDVLAHPKTALRLLVAHLMGSATNLRTTAEPATAKTETAREAFLAHPATNAMEQARCAARKALKLDTDAPIIAAPFGEDRTAAIFDALLGLDDKTVLGIAALVMAETLATGSAIVDAAGAILETKPLDHWQPDQGFLDLVRDREAASAMLVEVLGKTAAASYTADTAKRKKEIIAAALAGKNRAQVKGWCPRWLAFPQDTYTERPLLAHARPGA